MYLSKMFKSFKSHSFRCNSSNEDRRQETNRFCFGFFTFRLGPIFQLIPHWSRHVQNPLSPGTSGNEVQWQDMDRSDAKRERQGQVMLG